MLLYSGESMRRNQTFMFFFPTWRTSPCLEMGAAAFASWLNYQRGKNAFYPSA